MNLDKSKETLCSLSERYRRIGHLALTFTFMIDGRRAGDHNTYNWGRLLAPECHRLCPAGLLAENQHEKLLILSQQPCVSSLCGTRCFQAFVKGDRHPRAAGGSVWVPSGHHLKAILKSGAMRTSKGVFGISEESAVSGRPSWLYLLKVGACNGGGRLVGLCR